MTLTPTFRLRQIIRAAIPLAALLFLACSAMPGAGGSRVPAPEKEFLAHDPDAVQDLAFAPFDRVWSSDKSSFREQVKGFKLLRLRPIDTSHVPHTSPEGTSLSMRPTPEELKAIGEYFDKTFQAKVTTSTTLWLKPTDSEAPSVLIFDPVLTALTPTNAAVNAVSTAATFFIPGSFLISSSVGAGVGAVTGEVTKGSIGAAFKLIDGGTNTVIFEGAVFRSDPTAVLPSISSFSRYAESRKTIDHWAGDFEAFLTSDGKQSFKKPPVVTLGLF